MKSSNSIEYIGVHPSQRKTNNQAKLAWGMVLASALIGIVVLYQFSFKLIAADNQVNQDSLRFTLNSLSSNNNLEIWRKQIITGALKQVGKVSSYSLEYQNLSYPGGDINPTQGSEGDLLVRAFRYAGVDLQVLVYEDKQDNFYDYPQLWSQDQADFNIDHRRTLNLMRYCERHLKSLPITNSNKSDYQFGNIVFWRMQNGKTQLGIVVPGPGTYKNTPWTVSNLGQGPQWQDNLFNFQIIGHYSLK